MRNILLSLVMAGLLASFSACGDDEDGPPDLNAPTPTLDAEFPGDFPLPPSVTLINAFTLGSPPDRSLAASWDVEDAPQDVRAFYESAASSRWALTGAVNLLSSVALSFDDTSNQFETVSVQVTPRGGGSRISVLLGSGNAAAENPGGPPLEGRPPPEPAVLSDAFPEALIPPRSTLLEAVEVDDAGTLIAVFESPITLAEAKAHYARALAEVDDGAESTEEQGGALISWGSDEGGGVVTIEDGAPLRVSVMVRR